MRESRAAWTIVFLVVGLAMLGNILWIARDHQSPPWDQAHYLDISWVVRHAFSTGGFTASISAIYHTDPSYPPLYMLLIQPFEVVRNGVDASLVANTLMLGGCIAAAAVVAYKLFGRSAAIAAALFEATCPLIYGLSRTTLVDILLVLLASMSVMAAILSEGFQRRGWSLLCGVFVGLATLTKMTAPGLLLLPLVLSIWLPRKLQFRRQFTNAALAAIVSVLIASVWYAFNLSAALAYLRSATSGQLAIGTTSSPFTLHALAAYASSTIDSAVGTLLVLILLVAGALTLPRLLHRRISRAEMIRLAIPVSWFAVAFASLAVSSNQDVRYLAPGITGLVVLAAGMIAAIQPTTLRRIVLAGAALALGWQYISYEIVPSTPASASVQFGPSSFPIVIPFDGSDLIYTRPPGLSDYANPVVRILSGFQEHTDPGKPLNVCLLETQAVINGNTLGYVAESSGIPLTFTDLSYIPHVSAKTLAADLLSCPVALFIPGDSGQGRVGVLNKVSAAERISRRELAEFDGPRPVLSVGDGLSVEVLEHA